MSYVIASLDTTLQHRGDGRSRYFAERLHNTFSSAAGTCFYATSTTEFDDVETIPNVVGKTKMKLEKVAFAMHCNLRPSVVQGLNYQAHTAPAYQIFSERERSLYVIERPSVVCL